jgi:glycopeptide antibiotics resistance protein
MWRSFWHLWIAVIVLATTWPWSDFLGHTHWDKVRLVPFADRSFARWDMMENFLLFVPFGVLFMWSWPKWTRTAQWLDRAQFRSHVRAALATLHECKTMLLVVALLAALLSASVELFQVFTHTRIPSATDVCVNVLGSLTGGMIGAVWRR